MVICKAKMQDTPRKTMVICTAKMRQKNNGHKKEDQETDILLYLAVCDDGNWNLDSRCQMSRGGDQTTQLSAFAGCMEAAFSFPTFFYSIRHIKFSDTYMKH